MAPALFDQIRLGGLELANRIIVAPMCQYSADEGRATPWHVMHLGQMALSGAGLVIIEATAVEAAGRISPHDLGLWSDDTQAALASVLADIRRYTDTPIGIQLGHAGRKASSARPWEGGGTVAPSAGGWDVFGPSPLAFNERSPVPMALDKAGLERVRDAFVAAARRAYALGLDLIELHGAHGYLLHQFLSPLSNQRDDAYGGSLENRLRFPLEVFAAVRAAVPSQVPVGMRVSATDWVAGGWDVDQTIALATALRDRGADFIHVSSGGLSPRQEITVTPGYQVPFAAAVKAATGLPTIAVGLITDPHHANGIISESQADMVAIARGILYDPRWPWHAAAALGAQLTVAPQYLRCQPHGLKSLFR